MPRQARCRSESGIYHILLRGINKQVVFEEDEDREKFIGCLNHYKDISSYSLYGYCLMDNHIHLLMKEGKEPISYTMKRISVSYVAWYNRKYDRIGHLFQDRFKSEVVETDEYLLAVLRYIHQIPLKVGKTKSVAKYKWSSYGEYIGQSGIDGTGAIAGIFANKREKSLDCFRKYMNTRVGDNCIDLHETRRVKDEEVKELIQKTAGVKAAADLQQMQKEKRDEVIRKIKEIQGISTRQIARLTGISQSVVSKA